MLTGEQILAKLQDAGVRKRDIAKALGIPDSRVAELYNGKRLLKLDEAVKLVDAFHLDDGPKLSPLTTPIARLLVHHVARSVGADPEAGQVEELAADLRAFSAFAADRQVRDSVQAANGFLQSLRIRRTLPGAGPQELHPRKSH